jgi:hypothetical protein
VNKAVEVETSRPNVLSWLICRKVLINIKNHYSKCDDYFIICIRINLCQYGSIGTIPLSMVSNSDLLVSTSKQSPFKNISYCSSYISFNCSSPIIFAVVCQLDNFQV